MPDADDGNRYALETRAELLKLISAHVAVRRGELDRMEIGNQASSDAVAGLEALNVRGDLHESTRTHQVRAERLQTRIEGKLSAHMHSDTTLLGGAMAETHAGAVLVTAGMSDDLVAGGGVRATALADLWLSGLIGMEEKIGTAIADGALIEAFGTHFEREYGSGNHVAGFASFSGTIHTTMATGFRPLFKVASGVRNLTAGGGAGAAAEAPAATPPPAETVAPPPAPDAPPTTGLLADSQDIARVTDNVGDLASSTVDAEQIDFADLNRGISQLQSSADAPVRSADTAEELTQARYLMEAEIDDTLIRLRASAELPDDATIESVYNFVRRANAGKIGDDTFVTAASRAYADIDVALEPFRELLEDLPTMATDDFWNVRGLLAANAEEARAAGDIERAAELQGVVTGVDAIVYRHTTELLDSFPELAEGDELFNGLTYTSPPPAPTSTQYARQPLSPAFDLADATGQLEDLRSEWLEDVAPNIVTAEDTLDKADEAILARNEGLRARADLVGLALDELARGNDPVPALEVQVEQARLRLAAGTERFPYEFEILEDGADLIGKIVSDPAISPVNHSQATLDLLGNFNAKLLEARTSADWDALRQLSQAGDDLFAVNNANRQLLERVLGPNEVAELVDFRDAATVRKALTRAQDTASNPEDVAQLTAAINYYDYRVSHLIGEALVDAEIPRARSTPLPLEVDQAAVTSEFRQARQQILDQLAQFNPLTEDDELVQLEMTRHAQDYLNSYSYAIRLVGKGTDPTPFLDAEIEYLQYVIRITDPNREADILNQAARVQRLEAVRDHIRQSIQARAITDSLSAFDDTNQLEELAELARSADDTVWQPFLGDVNAPGTLRFEGPAPGGINRLPDYSQNEAVQVGSTAVETSRTLHHVTEARVDEAKPLRLLIRRNDADSHRETDGDAASATAGDDRAENAAIANDGYPLPPARLSSDIDAAALETAIGDVRDALLDPITGAPPTDAAVHIRRGAFTAALDAVAAGEDPIPALDALIADAQARANQNALRHPDEVAILEGSRVALAKILAEHRGADMPIDEYENRTTAHRIDGLRHETASLTEPGVPGDFVHPPSGLLRNMREVLSMRTHPYQDVRRYANLPAINVVDHDVDALDTAYAVLTRPSR